MIEKWRWVYSDEERGIHLTTHITEAEAEAHAKFHAKGYPHCVLLGRIRETHVLERETRTAWINLVVGDTGCDTVFAQANLYSSAGEARKARKPVTLYVEEPICITFEV